MYYFKSFQSKFVWLICIVFNTKASENILYRYIKIKQMFTICYVNFIEKHLNIFYIIRYYFLI